jgi:hypothetical protein
MQSDTQPLARETVPTMGGNYRLLERIGAGGMGVVYRGEQLALGRTVAIKLLHPELAAIPELVERFHVEARAASRLSHRGSVAVYDYGVSRDGAPFIVMEYVAGQSLTRLIRERWPMSLASIVDLGVQILHAVGDAHGAGVVHGDIKSDNVLVETDRVGVDHAKLVDYGLARLLDEAEPGVDEGVCGTPEYMAPEVATGEASTYSTDLYSVGAMLYEMLTGAPPFVGKTPNEVLERIVRDDVAPPSLKRYDIPADIEEVVMRALAKEPEDRFATAAQFAAALERARPPIADDANRCACGARIPPRARCCLGCGAAVVGIARPGFLDASTRSWDALELGPTKTRLARGSGAPEAPLDERVKQLRNAIGMAMARGAIDEIAEHYLALSRLLAGTIGVRAALTEIEEAIDVLTGGEGPGAEHAPEAVWPLLLDAARLYEAAGDRARARAAGAHAHLQAKAHHDALGRRETMALLERLRD